jgi:hypothetical protein
MMESCPSERNGKFKMMMKYVIMQKNVKKREDFEKMSRKMEKTYFLLVISFSWSQFDPTSFWRASTAVLGVLALALTNVSAS